MGETGARRKEICGRDGKSSRRKVFFLTHITQEGLLDVLMVPM